MQRTGGTNFTQRLVERSGLPATEHEPFNPGRLYGAVTTAWNAGKDEARLRQEIRTICQRRATIKHCVELVPWELSRVLMEESTAAGFAHLFLYRKRPSDRLLSLHFARQSGIWGPQGKGKSTVPGEEVFSEPLPVAALVKHERHCAELLRRAWQAALALGEFPVALAFEDIYKADRGHAEARLLPMLAALGLSRGAVADKDFVSQLLAKGNQGTHEKYAHFEGIAQLEEAVAALPGFRPVSPLAMLAVNRLSPDHPLIARAVVDSAPPVFLRAQLVEIGGVVVLARPIAGGSALVSVMSGHASSVSWSIASPKMKMQFPGSPNSAKSRFHLKTALHSSGATVMLKPHADGQVPVPLLELKAVPAALPRIYERIAAQGAKHPISDEEYDSLRQALDAVPAGEQQVAWLQASIQLDAPRRLNPAAVFAQIQKLRGLQLQAGEQAAFETFFDALCESIKPYSLGPHGYVTALAGRDQARIWADIGRLIQTVSSLAGPCFINSGTLLGAVRDGALIAHDDDVDLAVILPATSAAEVGPQWRALKESLRQRSLLDVKFDGKISTHAKIGRAGGASVDLFPAWVLEGRVYVWPHTCADLPQEAVLPLREIEVEGATVWMPREPERMLECNYGPGWRIRDPSFRFDWKTARERFSGFTEFLSEKGAPS